MKAILAAIDFSRVSRLVVAEAASLARAMNGKVVLVTVLAEPVYVKEYAPPPRSIAKITVRHERAVRHHLADLQDKLRSDFVPTDVVVRRGNAAANILEEAEERDAALLVIGSHGHNALFELVLGSTTQAVLKRSRRPVVVIPARMRVPRRPRLRVLSMTPVESDLPPNRGNGRG